ncbi:hypothetical protein CBR65_03975 [Cellvibrio sp. PSBB006]|nr:hypothetical protein CBR65_03975 [Cellvibrio sp. PSBB006]
MPALVYQGLIANLFTGTFYQGAKVFPSKISNRSKVAHEYTSLHNKEISHGEFHISKTLNQFFHNIFNIVIH